jgi:hypothetical protein
VRCSDQLMGPSSPVGELSLRLGRDPQPDPCGRDDVRRRQPPAQPGRRRERVGAWDPDGRMWVRSKAGVTIADLAEFWLDDRDYWGMIQNSNRGPQSVPWALHLDYP